MQTKNNLTPQAPPRNNNPDVEALKRVQGYLRVGEVVRAQGVIEKHLNPPVRQ